jgi:Flp pilus assembly protein TadG
MNGQKTRKEKGQSLVEFALILPILLLILGGVLDLGRMYYAYIVITDAAAEGVTYATIHPPNDPSNPSDSSTTEIRTRTLDACGPMSADVQSIQVVCPSCPNTTSGDTVTVIVTYNYAILTPFVNVMFPDGQVELQAIATQVILSGEVAEN